MKSLSYLALLPLLIPSTAFAQHEVKEPEEFEYSGDVLDIDVTDGKTKLGKPKHSKPANPQYFHTRPPHYCVRYEGKTVAPVSFDSVVKAVSHLPSEKDEYETFAQYEERIASAVGDASLVYVISTPFHRISPATNDKKVAYDAERQIITIKSGAIERSIDWRRTFSYGADSLADKLKSGFSNIDLIVSETEKTTGSYLGSNAFGATVRVREVERYVKVIFDRESIKSTESLFFSGLDVLGRHGYVITLIPAEPDVARALVPQLKAAVVVEARAPWVARGTGRKLPEIDSASDVNINATVLIADIRCALILDGDNKVLKAIETR